MSTSRFTFAELEFLLRTDERWPSLREALGMSYQPSDGIVAAGLASLIARELARVDGQDVLVEPSAQVPAAALIADGVLVSLALNVGEQIALSSFKTSDDPAGCILVSLVAAGVFDIRVFVPDAKPAVLLADLVQALLGEQDGALSLGTGDTVVQIHHAGDQWGRRSEASSPFVQLSAEQVKQDVIATFEPLLGNKE